MTAKEILAIERPQQLFDKDIIKKQYRKFALEWHPDKNGHENGEVFLHIEHLYEQGKKLIRNGLWDEEPNTRTFLGSTGNKISINCKRTLSFELGEFFIGKNHLTYFIRQDYKRLAANAIERLSYIHYANDVMKEEFSRYIGFIERVEEVNDGLLVFCGRPGDVYPLRDVLNHFKGKLHPRHVAWIMSSIYNICCFLEYNGLVHNNISIDSYFICPKYHSGILYGWWYAAERDQALTGLPRRTIENSRYDSRRAQGHVDMELIRLMGRELLGDSTGARIKFDKDIPRALALWLSMTSSKEAFMEYKNWHDVIIESWGKREFYEMEVDLGY